MLCQFCQVTFSFYLKYCRQCGNRLVKEICVRANTSQMVSTVKRADIGRADRKYSTSPMTQEIGRPINSVAEVLQNIMDEFPSLDTVKMSEVFPQLYIYQRKMSRTEQMRHTLREFDILELQEIERSSGMLSMPEDNTYKMVTTKIAIPTIPNSPETIEFKRHSEYLGQTLPFTSCSSATNRDIRDINKTKYVLDSDRLHSTRSLPTRLYLPNSGQLMKAESRLSSNSLAGAFRQTLSNIWMRMRGLAENLSVSFSINKSA